MNLRSVHIIFISAATLLTLFFGFWSCQQYWQQQTIGYILTAMGSWIFSVGLVAYGITFARKIKT